MIPACQAGSLEEAKTFFRRIGASAILKPVDNQGSRGVYRVDSEEENLRTSFGGPQLLVEKEVIPGEIHSRAGTGSGFAGGRWEGGCACDRRNLPVFITGHLFLLSSALSCQASP